jgi:hypothetical protein
MRTRTLVLLSVLVTAAVVGAALVRAAPSRDERRVATTAQPLSRVGRAVAVLGSWDRRRATAWARDDPAALRSLYLPGSRTARRDLAALTAYRRRGLRVPSMRRQVLDVRLRASTPRNLRLVVTDRLAEAVVTGAGERLALPSTRPATRTIVLRRVSGGWKVAEVYAD